MKLAKGLLESSLQPGSSILLSQLFGKAPRQPRLNQASRRRGEETESKSNFNTNGQSKSQSTASQSEKVSERPAHLLAKIPSKTSSNTSTRPSSPPKSMDLPPHLTTVIKATNNPSTAAKVVEAQSEENSKVTANAQRQRKDRRPKPAKQEIETLQPRAVESRLDGMAL